MSDETKDETKNNGSDETIISDITSNDSGIVINNDIETFGVQTSDTSSRVVGRPTVPTGKYLTMLYSVSGRTITLGIGTSSSSVWLGGSGSTTNLRVRCYKDGSLYQTKQFNYISSGVASPSTISFTISGTDACSVRIDCMCSSCDDGINHSGSGYEYEFDDSFTVSLAATQIIPTKPLITIYSPNNGSAGRVDYTNVNGGDTIYRCYPAETSSGSGSNNTLRFYVGRPGNATNCKIVLDRWLSGTGWQSVNDTGWSTEVTLNYHKTFSSSDRISSGAWWRVRSHAKSSTGDVSYSDYTYFIINDIPSFTPNLKSQYSIIPLGGSSLMSWSSASNSYLSMGYRYRYRKQGTSTWTEGTTSSTQVNMVLSDTGTFSRGSVLEFQVKAYDSYDETGYSGTVTVKVNNLPSASVGSISSNKDNATNNKRYVDNVTFTLPSINDSDGHSTSYKVEYNTGSGWNVYSNSRASGTLTLNCSSYQNTRGGSFQLRAIPYDGLEYGSYIYSSTLYKNRLPTLSSSTITTDKDGSPYYNCYVNNVAFTFPTVSDADGHSVSYKVEYKVGSGGWTLYNGSYSSNSLTLNCANYQNTRGQTMQLRVTAYDGFEYGDSATSAVLTRNQLPTAPTLTIDYGTKYLSSASDSPHNGHVEKIYQVKWNNISNFCNGQKIANSNVKVRFYRNNTNELYATYTGQDIDSMGGIPRNTGNYINSVTRGNPFKVVVEVTDILGESNSSQISYTRNQLPSVPTNFSVGFSGSVETVTNRQILFTKSTDPESDTIYYHLQVKRYNSTQWVDLSNNYLTSSTNVIWNLVDNSSHYGDVHRIRAIDEHEAASNWNSVEDTALPKASVTYPISVIYGAKPRILFKVAADNTKRYMSVEISVNGQKYNNLSHYQYFSLPLYKENSLGVFRCPVNLIAGNNTIIVTTYLGSISGTSVSSTITYNVCLENEVAQNTIITAARMSNIQKMINGYYSAYGCTFTKSEMISIQSGATISTTSIYNNILSNIIAINNVINNYDKDYCTNDKLRVSLTNSSVNNTTNHLIGQINTIIDIFKTKI